MKLINWMKAKKQKSKEKRQAKQEQIERRIGGAPNEILLDGDTGIEPPPTRFTEEYREFLAQQEAAGESDRETPVEDRS